MQFARGCAPFLAFPFLLAWITLIIGIAFELVPILIIATLFFLVTCGMLVFFRDPEIPVEEGIVSPANGKVFAIDPTDDGRVAIRIFMNVNNIHVNRCPLDGTVVKVDHKLGGHIPAFNKDAETNERVVTDLDTDIGPVRIVQIAGSVARRIVPYISDGQRLSKGDRIGIIRLGSRVDLHLPADRVEVITKIGETVQPNQTLARVIDSSPVESSRSPTVTEDEVVETNGGQKV